MHFCSRYTKVKKRPLRFIKFYIAQSGSLPNFGWPFAQQCVSVWITVDPQHIFDSDLWYGARLGNSPQHCLSLCFITNGVVGGATVVCSNSGSVSDWSLLDSSSSDSLGPLPLPDPLPLPPEPLPELVLWAMVTVVLNIGVVLVGIGAVHSTSKSNDPWTL